MSLALIFAGQGAQKVGMGKSLYENSAAARALYDEANRVLGWELTKLSFEGPEAELTQTKVCQPALFVHGLALHAVLKEQGKLPTVSYALGLSLGEVTALTAAGVFDFATGLKVVAERGRLMQVACEQTVGGMAAIVGFIVVHVALALIVPKTIGAMITGGPRVDATPNGPPGAAPPETAH